jgi:hypothetical protein
MACVLGEMTRGNGLAITLAILLMAGIVFSSNSLVSAALIASAPGEHSCDSVTYEQAKCAGGGSDACEVLPHISCGIELLAGLGDLSLQLRGCLVQAIALLNGSQFEILHRFGAHICLTSD